MSAEERPPADGPALVEVDHLKIFFPIKQGILVEREVARVHAVNDVTLSIAEGETLGLVGESGCGKTTMSRAIMRLIDATEGSIRFGGEDVTERRPAGRWQPLRREMQMVFQDPFASLNPRKRVGQIIGMRLRLHGTARGDGRSAGAASFSAAWAFSPSTSIATRTSSPAGSASASAWPGPSRSSRV